MRVTPALWIAAGLLCSALAARASGDVLLLRDGRRLEGQVIAETDASLTLDTVVASIRGEVVIPKESIAQHERKPVPEGFFARKDAPASQAAETGPADPPDPSGTRYLVIPVKGAFGRDAFPEGVADALEWASRRPTVRHIVFEVDSPGGEVWAANGMLRAMAAHKDRFRYHAVVRQAVSAAIWVVFSCDTIHVVDGAVIGGATPFRIDGTGSADVDAKMTSILSSMVVSAAEAHGHPGVLVRAMMLREARVVAWKGAANRTEFGLERPGHIQPNQLLLQDDDRSVLTLSHDQAVAIGVARHLAGPLDALGSEAADGPWRVYNDYGEFAMARSAEKMRKKQAEMERTWKANLSQLMRAKVRFEDHIEATSRVRTYNDLVRELGGARLALDDMSQAEKRNERAGLPRVFGSDMDYQVLGEKLQREVQRVAAERDAALRRR